MTGPLFKQLDAVIDGRTTVICLHAAGQIQPVGQPYDTLAGSFDEPPFHVHCRSVSVPYLPGMTAEIRAKANEELAKRPAKQRVVADGRAPNRIPGPSAPSAQAGPGAVSGPVVRGVIARARRWLVRRRRRRST